MPCWTINTYSATLDTITNWDRLGKVVEEMGWKISSATENRIRLFKDGLDVVLTRKEGQKGVDMKVSGRYVTEDQMAELRSELTRGYAKVTVRDAAKKFGWMTREDAKQKGRLRLTRGC